VANHATNLQTAKRPAVAERIDGFQHAGFAAAVRANQEVKAGDKARSALSMLRKSLIKSRIAI
jgi:hypothetical protein